MKKKGRSSFILFVTCIVLTAFIWIQQAWRMNTARKDYFNAQLFNLNPETLLSLEFVHSNVVIKCEKKDGVWLTGSPKKGEGRVDVALLNRVISGLNTQQKVNTITEQQLEARGFNDAQYGFAKPLLKIKAVDNLGTHQWTVGRKAPLEHLYYIREGNKKEIYTVSAQLLNFIPTKEDQLRDRIIFPSDLTTIRQLEIRGGNGFIQIIKDPDGIWKIQQPIVATANKVVVDTLLVTLQNLTIGEDDFIADDVSDFSIYGLQDENKQISLGGVDKTSTMLILGDIIPERPDFVYARRATDKTVFALKKSILDLISFKPEHFRDPRVLLIPPKEINHISITHGAKKLNLFATPSHHWAIVSPVSWSADPLAIFTLLKKWNDAVIIEYDLKNIGEKDEWTFLFGSKSLGQTNVIHVLPSYGKRDGLRIRRNDDPATYRINIPRLTDSMIDPLRFKDKLVLKLDLAQLKTMKVEQKSKPTYAIERQKDGTFLPVETQNPVQLDFLALNKMFDAIKNLRAIQYVAYDQQDLSKYGLQNPAMSIHLGLNATAQLGYVLLVGSKTDEGYYAMIKGRDVVFLLNKKVVEAFFNEPFIIKKTVKLDGE